MSKLTDLRDAARLAGLKRFWSVDQCRNGHIAERLTSNMTCCACSAEYRPSYQKENSHKWAEYRSDNRERLASEAREYRAENKVDISARDVARKRRKRNVDPIYAMRHRIRARIAMAYSGRLKPASTQRLIGCSFDEFALHMSKQFKEGMTWENRREWHIDHIIPVSSFDLSDAEQAKKAFHWSNCQPLWAKENLLKGSKLTGDAA